ncbi:MAG: hypothetical protein IPK83_19660 [Planctomycetes bacterium]|nr:hypothetical protein [Planctomycetota bacterium]
MLDEFGSEIPLSDFDDDDILSGAGDFDDGFDDDDGDFESDHCIEHGDACDCSECQAERKEFYG